jgi:hypothetical protein
MIRNEEDVQVYEMVFADINGDKTTILERGYSILKDNRIPPKGFTSEHISYDTVSVVGNANQDLDFNLDGIEEGSGADIIYFTIALNDYAGSLVAKARIYYQTTPPAWMAEMFEYDTEEILLFKSMYDNADKSPFLVAEAIIDSVTVGITEVSPIQVHVFPNPSDGRVYIQFDGNKNNISIDVYSINGQLVKRYMDVDYIDLPEEKGVYILRISDGKNPYTIKRIVRY